MGLGTAALCILFHLINKLSAMEYRQASIWICLLEGKRSLKNTERSD